MQVEPTGPRYSALWSVLIASAIGACSDRDAATGEAPSLGSDAGTVRVDADSEPDDAEGAVSDAGGQGSLSDAATNPQLAGDAATCAVASTELGLLPVHLAFAFDVSGSMGKGDKDWHDKSLKWDPVVRATRGFFEGATSQGLYASLSFFPSAGGEDDRCESASYTTPDVPMTALPSPAFHAAIQAIEPKDSGDWRGGTPTLFVMQGTRTFLKSLAQQQRGKFAIVLVTDGYPQGCDDDSDTIDAVVKEARAAAAEGVATYVIGVANPPISGAPDTVSDLEQIAVAGQTQKSYLIATGNETATVGAFQSAVNAIREAAASCEVAIPAPEAGRAFDKRKVAVQLKVDAKPDTALHYDSSCAGPNAWHYDDPADPKQIALCPDTCMRIQDEPKLRIEVQFACESLILL
jgi:hypothetical protein